MPSKRVRDPCEEESARQGWCCKKDGCPQAAPVSCVDLLRDDTFPTPCEGIGGETEGVQEPKAKGLLDVNVRHTIQHTNTHTYGGGNHRVDHDIHQNTVTTKSTTNLSNLTNQGGNGATGATPEAGNADPWGTEPSTGVRRAEAERRSSIGGCMEDATNLKYGYKKTAECTLYKKTHEEKGSSWNNELPKETIGHIQSAGCLGQKEVVIAAHNACIRELLQEVDGHGKVVRHMKLLTIETESSLGTLWDQKQCTQFCSKEELWEAAKEEEMRIPWKDEQEGVPVSEEQYQERFCRRRLDRIGLDSINKEFLAIEFKRTQDARSNYVEKATAVAQEQYTSLLTGLHASVKSKGGRCNNLCL
jgi:hypothetical protein